MSFRTKNNSVPNPATKFLSWKGKEGKFQYYDKDKGEGVDVELPVQFIVLEDYYSVEGVNSENDQRIFSNKFKDFRRDIVSVNMGSGYDRISGLYTDIKDKVKAKGGYLVKNLFAVLDGELVCIQFRKSNLAAYNSSKINDGENVVICKDTIEMKNKFGKWLDPVFVDGDKIKEEDVKEFLEKAEPYFEYIESMADKKELAQVTTEEPSMDEMNEALNQDDDLSADDIHEAFEEKKAEKEEIDPESLPF